LLLFFMNLFVLVHLADYKVTRALCLFVSEMRISLLLCTISVQNVSPTMSGESPMAHRRELVPETRAAKRTELSCSSYKSTRQPVPGILLLLLLWSLTYPNIRASTISGRTQVKNNTMCPVIPIRHFIVHLEQLSEPCP
jgi:hypothetical protein